MGKYVENAIRGMMNAKSGVKKELEQLIINTVADMR
jgi:hypothetical protein